MHITSIETTPNPNSMKLNFDQTMGKAETYTITNYKGCPEELICLLNIGGVQSIFVCNDFITINRDPRSDWLPILETTTALLGGDDSEPKMGFTLLEQQRQNAEKEGQVSIFVQTFRGIPIQVKGIANQMDKRVSIDERFNKAVQLIQQESGADYLVERYWASYGIRYGDIDQLVNEVADEIAGTIDNQSLEQLVATALGKPVEKTSQSSDNLRNLLNAPDWHDRLKAVQTIGTDNEAVELLTIALQDSHQQVRRLAAAALGATGSAEAVLSLCQTLLNDPAAGVRRTAGDALSDLGDISAQSAVCCALGDTNKLVRWRAARFLADIGTQEALPYLVAVASDSEFEVCLEIKAAMQRISGGLSTSEPAWKRILKKD